MQKEKLVEESESDSGSDRNPSDGNLDDKLVRMVLPVNNRGKGNAIISDKGESSKQAAQPS